MDYKYLITVVPKFLQGRWGEELHCITAAHIMLELGSPFQICPEAVTVCLGFSRLWVLLSPAKSRDLTLHLNTNPYWVLICVGVNRILFPPEVLRLHQ